jgi:Flp pilus assembly protein CpaB
MRSRGLVVAIAVVLAIVAAAAVILYTNGVKNDAVTGGALSVVVVSKQDIAANTNLNPLLEQGAFTELRVPTDAVVDGAVTSMDELRGQTTTAPILANEQIASARLSGGEAPQGGALGITPGNVGLPMVLEGGPAGYGVIQRGDSVVVYATFKGGQVVPKAALRQILSPAQLQKLLAASGGGKGPVVPVPFDYTATVVQSARVLNIQNPVVVEGNKFTETNIPLTLDLAPEDSEAVTFALAYADLVNLGLLPPENEDGYAIEASLGASYEDIVGVKK